MNKRRGGVLSIPRLWSRFRLLPSLTKPLLKAIVKKFLRNFAKTSLELRLFTKIGKNAVGWRYDPVFFGNGYDMDRHTSEFAKIAKELKGYTNFCVISFLDLYKKVRENAPNIYPPTYEEQKKLAKELVNIGRDNGILLRSCCESTHLAQCGVDVAGCQTKEILEYAMEKPQTKCSNAKYHKTVKIGSMKLLDAKFSKDALLCNFMAGSSELKYYSKKEKNVKIKEKPVIIEIDSAESVPVAKNMIDIVFKNISDAKEELVEDKKAKRRKARKATEEKPEGTENTETEQSSETNE